LRSEIAGFRDARRDRGGGIDAGGDLVRGYQPHRDQVFAQSSAFPDLARQRFLDIGRGHQAAGNEHIA